MNWGKIILDLCGGSGSWSKPYLDAGYDVRVIDMATTNADVRLFEYIDGPVHGVLAAPPCDQFSLARNGHPELPRDFLGGLSVADACLRIITIHKPMWWALENPVGLLSRWLGPPRITFDPCDFGDPYTKLTALWGEFKIPRGMPCRPTEGSKMHKSVRSPAKRAVTPPRFAEAFFRANP